MKQYFSLFLAICLLLTLAACGGNSGDLLAEEYIKLLESIHD